MLLWLPAYLTVKEHIYGEEKVNLLEDDNAQFSSEFASRSQYPQVYFNFISSYPTLLLLSIYLIIYLYFYHLSFYLSTFTSFYLSIYTSFYLSIFLPIRLSFYLSTNLSIYLFIYTSILFTVFLNFR